MLLFDNFRDCQVGGGDGVVGLHGISMWLLVRVV